MLMIMPLFIGTSELILIAALVLLLFGGKKLPEMMRGLGQGMKAFKEGMKEPENEKTTDTKDAKPSGTVAEGNEPDKKTTDDGRQGQ